MKKMPTFFVPGCKSGYKGCKGKHFFKPPADKSVFLKWVKAIPRKDKELSYKFYVCESHFSDELIHKTDVFVVQGKQVEIPRERWKLKTDAIPHIFPNLPQYLTKNVKNRKSPRKRQTVNREKGSKHKVARQGLNFDVCSQSTDCNVQAGSSNEKSSDTARKTVTLLKKKLKRQDHNLLIMRNKLKLANARIASLEKQVKDSNSQQTKLREPGLSKKQKIIVDTMIKKSQLKNKKGMRYNNEFLLDCY